MNILIPYSIYVYSIITSNVSFELPNTELLPTIFSPNLLLKYLYEMYPAIVAGFVAAGIQT